MYLSRLVLDPRHRTVRRAAGDCQALHRAVMSGFPDVPADGDARARLGVLYRLETHPRTGVLTLLVQSRAAPTWDGLRRAGYLLPGAESGDRANPECKPVADRYAALRAGQMLRFRLRANPTKRLSTPPGPAGRRPPGDRVELRQEADQLAWLAGKGGQGGFRVLAARVTTAGQTLGWDRPGAAAAAPARRLTFGDVLFDGVLRVTDADAFRQTLAQGIGPGKAYGFGLLSIAPGPEEGAP